MPVLRLHVPVLIRAINADGLGLQPVVLHQAQKVGIKLPSARTHSVRRRAAVVNLQPLRDRSQLLQARLQSLAQAQ